MTAKGRFSSRSLVEVRLRILRNIVEDLPDLEAEGWVLRDEDRERRVLDWEVSTHQTFGTLEDLAREISPWPGYEDGMGPEQLARYEDTKRLLRERMHIGKRLDLPGSWIPPDADGASRRWGDGTGRPPFATS